MKHEKAKNILPKHVIECIQQYIDGAYVYIPRKAEKRKAWGELTGVRAQLKIRNQNIYKSFLQGDSIPELSQRHYLTEQSIRRIIREEKKRL